MVIFSGIVAKRDLFIGLFCSPYISYEKITVRLIHSPSLQRSKRPKRSPDGGFGSLGSRRAPKRRGRVAELVPGKSGCLGWR